MSDDRLRTASEELRQASAAATDPETQQRLYDLSDRIATLAVADDGRQSPSSAGADNGRQSPSSADADNGRQSPSSADADEAPDGDDLMQHLHALGDLRESTDGDVHDRVDSALEAVRERREELED